MAAVNAALTSQLKAGDRVVAARLLFGSCHYILTELLPRFGVEAALVDGTDLDAWAAALERGAKLVFFETPGNPTLELVDIAAVAGLAHRAGARVIVDNVFATPILQRPLALGAFEVHPHLFRQGCDLIPRLAGCRDNLLVERRTARERHQCEQHQR